MIRAFGSWAAPRIRTRRRATGFGWLMGLFIFFSDYFSLLSGKKTNLFFRGHVLGRLRHTHLADFRHHVTTQLPYALTAAGLAAVGFLVVGHLMI